jgi:cyclopropane fatty-acyl-phospholipid synthase-like methyltransferase
MATWQTGELEQVSCDSCGHSSPKSVIVRPDGLTVCECPVCGLAFLNPRPTADRISRLYSQEYFAKTDTADIGDRTQGEDSIGYATYLDPAEQVLRSKVMQQRLDWVAQLLPKVPQPRLLEIGCATGELAELAHRRGWPITAIDLSSDAIAIARRKFPQIDFRVSTAEQLATKREQFQAVVAFEVIEHVLSPSRFLAACSELLAPGGVLVYSTPNYRTARQLREQWIGYHMSFEHLYFFSDETLERMGQQVGLDTVGWRTTGTGQLPPANEGARGWIKQTLQRTGLLPLVRSWKTRWRAARGGEQYNEFGTGHTLLFAFRKPAMSTLAVSKRSAA